jgi:hypothetical protein
MDRIFVLTAMIYAILGMVLGIVMAASKDHGQLVAHAHIMLVGFVVSFIYALCHKLWLNNDSSKLAWAQLVIHQLGALLISVGLFLFYGGYIAMEKIDPVLGMGSNATLLAMILMMVLFIKSGKAQNES